MKPDGSPIPQQPDKEPVALGMELSRHEAFELLSTGKVLTISSRAAMAEQGEKVKVIIPQDVVDECLEALSDDQKALLPPDTLERLKMDRTVVMTKAAEIKLDDAEKGIRGYVTKYTFNSA